MGYRLFFRKYAGGTLRDTLSRAFPPPRFRAAMTVSTITADQQAFAEQKDTVGGRKTFKAYLWQVCGEEYDAQH